MKIILAVAIALSVFPGRADSQTNIASGPGGRNKPGFVYDSARKKFLLFGGFGGRGEPTKGDTWEWDGAKWTQLATSGAFSRAEGWGWLTTANVNELSCSAALAPGGRWATPGNGTERIGEKCRLLARRRAPVRRWFTTAADRKWSCSAEVLRQNEPPPTDTWEWDGVKWTRVSSSGPAARTNHPMAYDSHRGRVVLFGGNPVGARGRFGDTWEWDGKNWTRVADSETFKRDHHGMTYDTARHRVVLFGGSNGKFLADTWAWDGKEMGRAPGGRALGSRRHTEHGL